MSEARDLNVCVNLDELQALAQFATASLSSRLDDLNVWKQYQWNHIAEDAAQVIRLCEMADRYLTNRLEKFGAKE